MPFLHMWMSLKGKSWMYKNYLPHIFHSSIIHFCFIFSLHHVCYTKNCSMYHYIYQYMWFYLFCFFFVKAVLKSIITGIVALSVLNSFIFKKSMFIVILNIGRVLTLVLVVVGVSVLPGSLHLLNPKEIAQRSTLVIN